MSVFFVLEDIGAVIRAVERLPVLFVMIGIVIISLVLRDL
jgi:hypothetical protein